MLHPLGLGANCCRLLSLRHSNDKVGTRSLRGGSLCGVWDVERDSGINEGAGFHSFYFRRCGRAGFQYFQY